jgi:hypothetical protein
MITIGRWAKRHGVSAGAAVEVMRPSEAHHTGTGRRGKSRLTPVIARDTEPTPEQLAALQAWDRGERPTVRGWYTAWEHDYSGPYGRRRNIPRVGIYEGDPAVTPRGFEPLNEKDFAKASELAGRRLNAWASRFDDIRDD